MWKWVDVYKTGGSPNYNKEFTLLYGAIEKDTKYIPRDAPEQAESRRLKVVADPDNRRCAHEQVTP